MSDALTNRARVRCPHCESIYPIAGTPLRRLGNNKYGIGTFECPSCSVAIKIDPYEWIEVSAMIERGDAPEGSAVEAYKLKDLMPAEKLARQQEGWFSRLFR